MANEPSSPVLSVSSSVLAPAGLAHEIAAAYPVAATPTCHLLRSYVNDVYQVQTAEAAYILKVYRAGWRTWREVTYEVEMLTHLRRQHVPVAAAVPRWDGRLVGEVQAPEGPRPIVLFEMAPGTKPQPPFTPALYERFGQATARLHTALDDFTSPQPRTPLDFTYFLDRPLQTLAPYFTQRPDDWRYLRDLVARARTRLGRLAADGLEWGVCHGDLTLDNLHVTEDCRVVFYDFDSGGPGWRAADPYGVFQYQAAEDNGVWDAFLGGYRTIRPFSATQVAAVPWFVVLYTLWGLAFDAGVLAQSRGQWIVGTAYFDRALAVLRAWNARFCAEQE